MGNNQSGKNAIPTDIVGQYLPYPLYCSECDDEIELGPYTIVAVAPDQIGPIARPAACCEECRTARAMFVILDADPSSFDPRHPDRPRIIAVYTRETYLDTTRRQRPNFG